MNQSSVKIRDLFRSSAKKAQSRELKKRFENKSLVLATIENHNIAFPSIDIREIIKTRSITPIRCSNLSVIGVINHDSQIVPVINLAVILGNQPSRCKGSPKIALIKHQTELFGIAVDEVFFTDSLQAKAADQNSPDPVNEGIFDYHILARGSRTYGVINKEKLADQIEKNASINGTKSA